MYDVAGNGRLRARPVRIRLQRFGLQRFGQFRQLQPVWQQLTIRLVVGYGQQLEQQQLTIEQPKRQQQHQQLPIEQPERQQQLFTINQLRFNLWIAERQQQLFALKQLRLNLWITERQQQLFAV